MEKIGLTSRELRVIDIAEQGAIVFIVPVIALGGSGKVVPGSFSGVGMQRF